MNLGAGVGGGRGEGVPSLHPGGHPDHLLPLGAGLGGGRGEGVPSLHTGGQPVPAGYHAVRPFQVNAERLQTKENVHFTHIIQFTVCKNCTTFYKICLFIFIINLELACCL